MVTCWDGTVHCWGGPIEDVASQHVQGSMPRAARSGRADEGRDHRDEAGAPSGPARSIAGPERGGLHGWERDAARRRRRSVPVDRRVVGCGGGHRGRDRMNVLLDTHVLLWWKAGGERLSARARRDIARADAVLLSPLSFWEIGMLTVRGRIRLDRTLL